MRTGSVESAATRKLKYAASASPRRLVRCARRSNNTPTTNSPMGKWIKTTCCACFAKTIVLISNGFTLIGRSLHDDRTGHFGMDRAEIGICSCFVEGKGELFLGIQHLSV